MTDATNADSSKPSSGNRRQTILLVVLGLFIIAIVYDYKVARPAVDAAYDNLLAEYNRANASSTDFLSPGEVHEILNKTPASKFADGDDEVEVFAWQSGVPLRPHKLYVAYGDSKRGPMMQRHTKYFYESKKTISREREKGSDAQSEEFKYPDSGSGSAEAMPGGGGPEGGPQGGPGGRGQFDPEATFRERDADGDGQIRGEEIGERMQQNLESIDSDGDGAVSLEEFVTGIERVRELRGEGDGRRGGGRPETEEDAPAQEADSNQTTPDSEPKPTESTDSAESPGKKSDESEAEPTANEKASEDEESEQEPSESDDSADAETNES